jgi:HD-GYP domain-containing protein (c-di-GMP phosphodiesterase class II)
MTSDRPYHSAFPLEAARGVIERGAGKQYDARVASIFLSIPIKVWEVIRRETAAMQIFSLAAVSDSKILAWPEFSGGL